MYKYNLGLLSKQMFTRFAKEENRFDTSLLMIGHKVRSIINTIGNDPEHKNALVTRNFRADEYFLKMQNQDFTSTLNTHRVSETNAAIGVSKGFEVFKQATEKKMQ
jgi:hypothetical protein